jgi:hypothetical protein
VAAMLAGSASRRDRWEVLSFSQAIAVVTLMLPCMAGRVGADHVHDFDQGLSLVGPQLRPSPNLSPRRGRGTNPPILFWAAPALRDGR